MHWQEAASEADAGLRLGIPKAGVGVPSSSLISNHPSIHFVLVTFLSISAVTTAAQHLSCAYCLFKSFVHRLIVLQLLLLKCKGSLSSYVLIIKLLKKSFVFFLKVKVIEGRETFI